MAEEKKLNSNDFCKIDENTVFLVTYSERGLIRSYIHLCPKTILEASKKSCVEKSVSKGTEV